MMRYTPISIILGILLLVSSLPPASAGAVACSSVIGCATGDMQGSVTSCNVSQFTGNYWCKVEFAAYLTVDGVGTCGDLTSTVGHGMGACVLAGSASPNPNPVKISKTYNGLPSHSGRATESYTVCASTENLGTTERCDTVYVTILFPARPSPATVADPPELNEAGGYVVAFASSFASSTSDLASEVASSMISQATASLP